MKKINAYFKLEKFIRKMHKRYKNSLDWINLDIDFEKASYIIFFLKSCRCSNNLMIITLNNIDKYKNGLDLQKDTLEFIKKNLRNIFKRISKFSQRKH
jgi:hypothetical protein